MTQATSLFRRNSAEQMKILRETYKEMPVGVQKLYRWLSENRPDVAITRAMVADFLRGNKVQQTHTIPRRVKNIKSFVPSRPFSHLQIDLIDYSNKPAMQFKYVLMCVDLFSRYLFAERITSKKAQTVATAFGKVLDKIGKIEDVKPIKIVQSDQGSEFNKIQEALNESQFDGAASQAQSAKHIKSLSYNPASQGVVERNNGSFKRLMAKYIEMNGGNWGKHLQHIISIMNHTYSQPIDVAPITVIERLDDKKFISEIHERLKVNAEINEIPHENNIAADDINVGDRVRVKMNKSQIGFSGKNFSDDISIVSHKRVNRKKPFVANKYRIMDPDGTTYRQWYSAEQLLKVP